MKVALSWRPACPTPLFALVCNLRKCCAACAGAGHILGSTRLSSRERYLLEQVCQRVTSCSTPSFWRAGGMEAPRDDHKLTHNMKLATRDKLFGGTVSRLQVRPGRQRPRWCRPAGCAVHAAASDVGVLVSACCCSTQGCRVATLPGEVAHVSGPASCACLAGGGADCGVRGVPRACGEQVPGGGRA